MRKTLNHDLFPAKARLAVRLFYAGFVLSVLGAIVACLTMFNAITHFFGEYAGQLFVSLSFGISALYIGLKPGRDIALLFGVLWSALTVSLAYGKVDATVFWLLVGGVTGFSLMALGMRLLIESKPAHFRWKTLFGL